MAANDDDFGLFREAMAKSDKLARKYGTGKSDARRDAFHATSHAASRATLREVGGDLGVMIDDTGGEVMVFCRSGLQKKILQRLKRGGRDYRPSEILDLHGSTKTEAGEMLAAFIAGALADGARHVMVIHGKGLHSPGRGVLKKFTADWLKRQAAVKAFCSAQARDGGSGAVYVLLQRR